MYFTSRTQAGLLLAERLAHYRFENTVIVSLSDGGVLVGEPIAEAIHSIITIMLAEDVIIPGETSPLGSINQEGGFAYNSSLSSGEVDEYQSEFHGYIEGQKLEHLHHMHQLVGETGVVDRTLLQHQNVIVVSDGFKNGTMLDAAAQFLKPVRMQKLIFAVPVASVEAIDRMHIVGDEIHVLSVTDNYLDTGHYYDDNTIPDRSEILTKIRQMVLNWQ